MLSHAAMPAANAMTSFTATHPEPVSWFSTCPENVLHHLPDGNFVSPAGETLLSATQILDRVWPKPTRDCVVARSAVAYANSLANPAAAARGPWRPTVEPFLAAVDMISPLISHPFWQQITVLGSPVPLRHRRLPVATSADLLVRFKNGGDIGIGLVQTARAEQFNPRRVEADLGAALALLNDSHCWWPRRSFVVFASAGKTTVELVDVNQAVSAWLDALDLYRCLERIEGLNIHI